MLLVGGVSIILLWIAALGWVAHAALGWVAQQLF